MNEKPKKTREIKFRAWDRSAKQLFPVHYLTFDSKTGLIKHVAHGEQSLLRSIENYILEQYTGLKDKNGREIFEGDIVHIWSNFYQKDMPCALVFWNEKLACFDIKHPNGIYHNWLRNLASIAWDIEILGNIHENPELLKEDNNG